MNERIKELAKQAGAVFTDVHAVSLLDDEIEKFAALVAADEREACKKLAKEHAAEYKVGGRLHPMLGMNISKAAEAACDHIAHLISERGQA